METLSSFFLFYSGVIGLVCAELAWLQYLLCRHVSSDWLRALPAVVCAATTLVFALVGLMFVMKSRLAAEFFGYSAVGLLGMVSLGIGKLLSMRKGR